MAGVTSVSLTLSACGIKASEVPTTTSLPLTNTSFPISTFVPTPTAVPTLVGLSVDVPDPRISNPELFDLTKPNSLIPQFANALNAAGGELTSEQIIQQISYQEFKDSGDDQFVVAFYTIASIFTQKSEFLDKPIPFLIATQNEETKEWKWGEATPSNLGNRINILIGSVSDPPGSEPNADEYHRLKENRFNSSIAVTDVWSNREKQEGVKNWDYIDMQIDEALDLGVQVVRIVHLLSNDSIPDWLDGKTGAEVENISQEHIQEHMHYIYNKIQEECNGRGINNLTIEFNVVNELSYSSVFYKVAGGRDRFVLISCQKAIEVKNAILSEKGSGDPNIQIRLGISDSDSHYIGGNGYQALLNFLTMLENNAIFMDYVDLHGHEKNVYALPDIRLIDGAIKSFAKYKNPSSKPIDVTIGEYDLNIKNWEGDSQRFLKQAERYFTVFNTFLNAGVKEILLWGVADSESWYEHKDEIETEYFSPNADPLVFDDNGMPKLDYYAIIAAVQQYTFL